TRPWLPRPDGNPGGPQRAQAPSRKGAQTAGDCDPTQAAGLTRQFTFPAVARLHQRAEFNHVRRYGVRVQTTHFVLYAALAGPTSRLGMAVSRRVGNAVIRNRLKRYVREAFRLTLRTILPPGTALVVIARS